MPMPQLKVRSISRSLTFRRSLCSQPKTGGQGTGEIDLGHAFLGQDARDVFEKAAAGDMGQRLDAICALSAASTGFT